MRWQSVLDYKPPSGLISRSKLVIDEETGLLQSQCNHIHKNGKGRRCKNRTNYDYRLCDYHLLHDLNLLVAKSRIQSANLGLYSADHRLLPSGYMSQSLPRDPPPLRHHHVVFNRSDLVGRFGGELIDNAEYERRYSNGFGKYAIGITDDQSQDESVARTAMSYANDGVNLGDKQMRRNYSHHGTHVVWHDLQWPHVINAYSGSENNRVCLFAMCDLVHGDEILWSYSGSHNPSKDENGKWVIDATGEIVDLYWCGQAANGP